MTIRYFHNLLTHSLIRRIFSLLFGYGIAQLILVITTPILTRLYSPELFGTFGVIFSVVTILLSISTLRYEYAIPLINTDDDVSPMVHFCLLISILTTVALLFFYFLLPKSIITVHLTFNDILFCVVAIIFQAFSQVYSMPLVSHGKTRSIAYGRLLQNASMVVIQIIFAFFSPLAPVGLVVGFAVGLIVNAFYYRAISNRMFMRTTKLTVHHAKYFAKKYYKFPLYSSWSGLLDSASTALPIFFIGPIFGKPALGLYFLVFRIFSAPTGLVARAVSLVITKEFADHEKNQQKIRPLFLRLTAGLMVFSLLYFILMFLLSYCIEPILGIHWSGAGEILRALSWVIAIIATASPLSAVFGMIHRNEIAAIWQVMYVTTTAGVMYFGKDLEFSIFLDRLVVAWFFLYVVYWLMAYMAVCKWDKELCVE